MLKYPAADAAAALPGVGVCGPKSIVPDRARLGCPNMGVASPVEGEIGIGSDIEIGFEVRGIGDGVGATTGG